MGLLVCTVAPHLWCVCFYTKKQSKKDNVNKTGIERRGKDECQEFENCMTIVNTLNILEKLFSMLTSGSGF